MQLAGTRAGDRRAGRADAQRPGHSCRGRSAWLTAVATAAPAPGADGGSCNAGCRPEGPAPGGRARRSAASPGTQYARSAPSARRRRWPVAPGPGHQHLAAFRADHVEAARELRVAVTEQEADPSPSLFQHQEEVASLLGDSAAVGVGGHPAHMDPTSVQLDEEQYVQSPQPHCVDGEEVARHDPGGLLPQKRLPGRGRPSCAGSRTWRRSVVRIAVAETRIPNCCSSPLRRW
jgi:hypothetical protein